MSKVSLRRKELPNGEWQWLLDCPHGLTRATCIPSPRGETEMLPAGFDYLRTSHHRAFGCVCAERIQRPVST